MSAHEAVSIIVRARREGVTLFAKADGKLGWKGAQGLQTRFWPS